MSLCRPPESQPGQGCATATRHRCRPLRACTMACTLFLRHYRLHRQRSLLRTNHRTRRRVQMSRNSWIESRGQGRYRVAPPRSPSQNFTRTIRHANIITTRTRSQSCTLAYLRTPGDGLRTNSLPISSLLSSQAVTLWMTTRRTTLLWTYLRMFAHVVLQAVSCCGLQTVILLGTSHMLLLRGLGR